MLSEEIKHLKAGNRLDLILALGGAIALSVVTYLMDGARLVAFGVIPAVAIVCYYRQRGVNFEKTPILLSLVYTAALACIIGVVCFLAYLK